jgi:hypothetical protein
MATTTILIQDTSPGGKHSDCASKIMEMMCGIVAPPCVPPKKAQFLNAVGESKSFNLSSCVPMHSICPKVCHEVTTACDNFRSSDYADVFYFDELTEKGSNLNTFIGITYDNEIEYYKRDNNLDSFTVTPLLKDFVYNFFTFLLRLVTSLVKDEPKEVATSHCLRFLNKYRGVNEENVECNNNNDNVLGSLQVQRDQNSKSCLTNNDTIASYRPSGIICPKVCVGGQSWMTLTYSAIVICLACELIVWLIFLIYMFQLYETNYFCPKKYCNVCSSSGGGGGGDGNNSSSNSSSSNSRISIIDPRIAPRSNIRNKTNEKKSKIELVRLRFRQLIVLIVICYVIFILIDKVRNVLLFPTMSIGAFVTTIIVLLLWIAVLMGAFVTVSTMHEYHGILRYGVTIATSNNLYFYSMRENLDGEDDPTDEKEINVDETSRRNKCRHKWLNCDRGPVSWYSNLFGIRRGRYYFYSKLTSEIFEWSLSLATLQSLVTSISLQYTYCVITLLIINVIVSPLLFLFRDKTPVMREIVLLFDTTLDLFYLQLMSLIMIKQSDLEQPVYVFGFIGPFPALLIGVVWPIFLVLWRFWSLNLGFLRMVIEHKLEQELAEDLSIFKESNLKSAPLIVRRIKKRKKRRSSFLGLHIEQLKKQNKNNSALRKQSCIKCCSLGIFERFSASLIIIVVGSMLTHAIVLIYQQDVKCAESLDQSKALWWGATPRIVSRKIEEYQHLNGSSKTMVSITGSPMASIVNPFVGHLDCSW